MGTISAHGLRGPFGGPNGGAVRRRRHMEWEFQLPLPVASPVRETLVPALLDAGLVFELTLLGELILRGDDPPRIYIAVDLAGLCSDRRATEGLAALCAGLREAGVCAVLWHMAAHGGDFLFRLAACGQAVVWRSAVERHVADRVEADPIQLCLLGLRAEDRWTPELSASAPCRAYDACLACRGTLLSLTTASDEAVVAALEHLRVEHGWDWERELPVILRAAQERLSYDRDPKVAELARTPEGRVRVGLIQLTWDGAFRGICPRMPQDCEHALAAMEQFPVPSPGEWHRWAFSIPRGDYAPGFGED